MDAPPQPSSERPARWVRRITGVAAAVPVLGAVVAAAAAWRAVGPAEAVLLTAVCAVPALAAVVVRARLVWLVEAIPQVRSELRVLAERSDRDAAPDDPDAAALRARAAELSAASQVPGRRSPRALVRMVRLLRSPATEVARLASRRFGERAAASLPATTGAVDRVVGLVALSWVAAVGAAALWLLALLLLVVGSLRG